MPIESLIVYVLAPLAAYLLGSVPFAFVIGQAHGVDIRKVGSGNVGATNLARALGKKYFFQAFALDALKGFLPVLLVALFIGERFPVWTPLIAGAAAMLGHVFPLYLKFRGGKGVATAFGIVLGLWPLYTVAGLLAGLTFVVVFMAFRYISVGSMVAAIAFALYVLLLGREDVPGLGQALYTPPERLYPLFYIALAFAALIVLKHRSNLLRLLKGTEPKWGQKK